MDRLPICLPGARLIAYSRFLSLLKYARRRLAKILKSLGCLQLKQRAPAALIGMHTTSQKHLAPSPFTIEGQHQKHLCALCFTLGNNKQHTSKPKLYLIKVVSNLTQRHTYNKNTFSGEERSIQLAALPRSTDQSAQAATSYPTYHFYNL